MKKITSTILLIAIFAIGLVGCSKQEEKKEGYAKEDFGKTAPPPGWKGPGQPGGPSTGPVTGPTNTGTK